MNLRSGRISQQKKRHEVSSMTSSMDQTFTLSTLTRRVYSSGMSIHRHLSAIEAERGGKRKVFRKFQNVKISLNFNASNSPPESRCPAKVWIRIEKPGFRSHDEEELIQRFPCVITLSGFHSHDPQSLESVSKLKISKHAKGQLLDCYE